MPHNLIIVEDDALIAADLDDILESAGFVVVGIAPDMHAALAIAKRIHIDVAIMDVDLAAGTNGVETARRLREQHDVASLFVSARIDDELRAMASEWRPVGFVPKPYAGETIVRALRAALPGPSSVA